MAGKYPGKMLVALRLAVLLKRSGKARVRVSERTLKILSQRRILRDAFMIEVRDGLDDLGVVIVRIERGGFALIETSSLEGATPALVKNLMKGYRDLSPSELWEELDLPDDTGDE